MNCLYGRRFGSFSSYMYVVKAAKTNFSTKKFVGLMLMTLTADLNLAV